MAKILDNIQKAMFEIKSLIQGNSDIRKLVYYDSKDALDQDEISFDTPAEHFTVSAIFDVTEPPFDKNTIISITFSDGKVKEDTVEIAGLVKVNILTRSGLWELNGNKIRPLEVANLIISELDNQKVSNSHKIVFGTINLSILNENMSGYSLTFLLQEGSGFSGEF